MPQPFQAPENSCRCPPCGERLRVGIAHLPTSSAHRVLRPGRAKTELNGTHCCDITMGCKGQSQLP